MTQRTLHFTEVSWISNIENRLIKQQTYFYFDFYLRFSRARSTIRPVISQNACLRRRCVLLFVCIELSGNLIEKPYRFYVTEQNFLHVDCINIRLLDELWGRFCSIITSACSHVVEWEHSAKISCSRTRVSFETFWYCMPAIFWRISISILILATSSWQLVTLF